VWREGGREGGVSNDLCVFVFRLVLLPLVLRALIFLVGVWQARGWLVFSILRVPHTHTPTRKEKGRATGGKNEKKEKDNFNNKKKKKTTATTMTMTRKRERR